MIITLRPTSSDTTTTLAAGSVAGEPVSGLSVQVARRTRILTPVNAAQKVLPDGGQSISISFNTYKAKSSGALHGFGGLASPSIHEKGTVEITAPDGALLILSPAAVTGRKTSQVAGSTVGWSYNVIATDYAISAEAVDYLLDVDNTVIVDIDGTIIVDAAA